MNDNIRNSEQDIEDKLKALHTNANAIRAISSAVEGTFGPKGLDTMLVDSSGEVVITNDGVTILNMMEVNHPAAKMLIQVARSQQQKIGDGTTTATILSSELLTEAVNQVNKGVPIPKVIAGIKKGIQIALDMLQDHSRSIGVEDDLIHNIAYIAGREHQAVANLIIDGAKLLGNEKLLDESFMFSESIIAHEGSENELISGLILNKKRMNSQMPNIVEEAKLLVIEDALEPEDIDEEALGTEIGFSKYLEYKEIFKQNLRKIVELGVGVILVDRGVDPIAEEFCIDNGIVIIQRLSSRDIKRVVENTGAKTIKRTGLNKSKEELQAYLGVAKQVIEDEKLQKIRVIKGHGKPMATILVGASTGEIVGEKERIAKDAAASVQAAIKGGYVPGGGSIELAIAKKLKKYREQVRGLESFGIETVATALIKPISQIILNAGFNPLEKIEEVKAAQNDLHNDALGIDTDTAKVIDMEKAGVIDPTLVKIHALKAAGEIAEAILRIHTIIRMKKIEDFE